MQEQIAGEKRPLYCIFNNQVTCAQHTLHQVQKLARQQCTKDAETRADDHMHDHER